MDLIRFPARHVHNPLASPEAVFGDTEQAILGLDAVRQARREIETWPGYAPTPLIPLPAFAQALGLGTIHYKDEAHRFGLGSFKALGGAYAVLRLLQTKLRRQGIEASAADLLAGRHRELTREVTVATATDGNHGRSVAWGARQFGCRCVIYIHEAVSPAREQAIARFGAEIRRLPGGYDESVRRCAEEAWVQGWLLVADTSADDQWQVPALVMQGYGLLAEEALEQAEAPFTHVFVQAGVGGLAAAVAAVLWQRLGAERPRIVVVEPERADCVFRTVKAGRPTPVPGEANTFMACLAAGEISSGAWPILKRAADDVLALPDEAAGETMRLLAVGEPPIVAGESGCAATAGLVAAALDPALAQALGLGCHARVLVIGSEGATDSETYARTVGRPAELVAA